MNTAIVLAGGSGRRMNSDIPKQYMMLKGKPVIYYSLKAFQDNLHIDDIILVTSDHYIEYVKKNILDDTLDKVSKVIQGGVERYDSVWEGLKCIKESGYVFIHDGARPCISQKLINDCYEAVVEDGACIAAVPVKDTIKIADSEGYAAKTPDMNTLWICPWLPRRPSATVWPAFWRKWAWKSAAPTAPRRHWPCSTMR